MSSDNKNSNIKTLLEKIKKIQDQNTYKSINDMEINKYYKIVKLSKIIFKYLFTSKCVSIFILFCG